MKRVIVQTLLVSVVAAGAVSSARAQQAQEQGATVMTVTPDGVVGRVFVGPDGKVMRLENGAGGSFDADNSGPGAPAKAAPSGNINFKGSGVLVSNGKMTMDTNQLLQRSHQQTEDALREALGATEDEWRVLLPKIHNIQALQAAIMPGSPVRVPKLSNDLAPIVTELSNRIQEFHDLVSNKDTPNGQVTQALVAVRDARNNVKTRLAQARRDLTELLTLRQEAILFERGILAD